MQPACRPFIYALGPSGPAALDAIGGVPVDHRKGDAEAGLACTGFRNRTVAYCTRYSAGTSHCPVLAGETRYVGSAGAAELEAPVRHRPAGTGRLVETYLGRQIIPQRGSNSHSHTAGFRHRAGTNSGLFRRLAGRHHYAPVRHSHGDPGYHHIAFYRDHHRHRAGEGHDSLGPERDSGGREAGSRIDRGSQGARICACVEGCRSDVGPHHLLEHSAQCPSTHLGAYHSQPRHHNPHCGGPQLHWLRCAAAFP